MTDLTDRITEVLREHRAIPHSPYYWRCPYPCPWKNGEREDHEVHVAQQIAEALQHEVDRRLTEAWRAGFNEAMRSTCDDKRWWSTAAQDKP